MNSLDPWRVIATDTFGDVVWPRPYYGHPFYQDVPSWIHYGAPDETTRHLFEGVFVGADYAGAELPQAKDLMSNTGITFKKELDDHQVLHVEICVDGKCYRTSMDLAPAIAMVMEKFSRAHSDLHKMMGPVLSGDVVVSAIDRGVGVAGDALIGMLAHQHTHGLAVNHAVAVGGFFDDVGHALSGAANAVGGVLKQLKGPASIAAGAAATAFGGPAAGPVAAQLTGALIDAAPGGGHPAAKAAAQKTVEAAKQVAKTNPTVQTALDAAHHAASQTTMAALGHVPAVPATPNTLASAVQKFLPLATSAVTGSGSGGAPLPTDLQGALSVFGGLLSGGGAAPAVAGCTACEAANTAAGGWYDVIGAVIDDVRAHAQSIAAANNASVVGVIRTARGNWQARGFRDADIADDWLGASTSEPSSFTYAAIYDKSDVLWPHPLNEKIGTAHGPARPERPIPREVATTSGA